MSLKKNMKGLPLDVLSAEGLLSHNWTALTANQRECTARIGMTMQMEQEAYLIEHPEVRAMMEIFVSKMACLRKRKDVLKEAALHFTRPVEILDQEIRERLDLPPHGPYTKKNKPTYKYEDLDLELDLKNIVLKHNPPEEWKITTPIIPALDTASSSFLSVNTSDTTLPIPELIPTPEPTLSETFFAVISNTVDKAIFLHVDDAALHYDIAYVEIRKAVEVAMEVPVIEIREDIAELFCNAYRLFELIILEKERIAAEIAWEKRMGKKMKRTLRRLNNFKGSLRYLSASGNYICRWQCHGYTNNIPREYRRAGQRRQNGYNKQEICSFN
ncbi:uncharacterized protein LOC131841842 isoform X2 [Achroia grisella]|uniref:uncharacterized protein LOC131841842 isoform X2 n=1 Tax=Achroia grisella TaxID=688607 RepID=UPI0027D33148|nr:uncharacterized protein LOC131841842 isoform X2 [Achroia grisella]